MDRYEAAQSQEENGRERRRTESYLKPPPDDLDGPIAESRGHNASVQATPQAGEGKLAFVRHVDDRFRRFTFLIVAERGGADQLVRDAKDLNEDLKQNVLNSLARLSYAESAGDPAAILFSVCRWWSLDLP